MSATTPHATTGRLYAQSFVVGFADQEGRPLTLSSEYAEYLLALRAAVAYELEVSSPMPGWISSMRGPSILWYQTEVSFIAGKAQEEGDSLSLTFKSAYGVPAASLEMEAAMRSSILKLISETMPMPYATPYVRAATSK